MHESRFEQPGAHHRDDLTSCLGEPTGIDRGPVTLSGNHTSDRRTEGAETYEVSANCYKEADEDHRGARESVRVAVKTVADTYQDSTGEG